MLPTRPQGPPTKPRTSTQASKASNQALGASNWASGASQASRAYSQASWCSNQVSGATNQDSGASNQVPWVCNQAPMVFIQPSDKPQGSRQTSRDSRKAPDILSRVSMVYGHRPLRGRCPANIKQLTTILDKQQGKGTDDHILPLGI